MFMLLLDTSMRLSSVTKDCLELIIYRYLHLLFHDPETFIHPLKKVTFQQRDGKEFSKRFSVDIVREYD